MANSFDNSISQQIATQARYLLNYIGGFANIKDSDKQCIQQEIEIQILRAVIDSKNQHS
jgi:hypothetical protein